MIGILVLHGMGPHEGDFDAAFREDLLQRLPARLRGDVVWQPVHYNSVLQARQDAVWSRMQGQPLGGPVNQGLRRFLLDACGDLMAYGNQQLSAESPYLRVHAYVRDAIAQLHGQMAPASRVRTPVLVFAQSLGCQVLSNYMWDAQNQRGLWTRAVPDALASLSTLRGLVTTGCSIPLLVSALARTDIRTFRRPDPRFRWVNYYDPDDALGWPLRPLSSGFADSYESMVERDERINVGAAQGSHVRYWSDRQFVRAAAQMVQDINAAGI